VLQVFRRPSAGLARSGEAPPAAADIVFDGVGFAPPGGPEIVTGIDLDVRPGEFHCLLGRSGCGKTTLLKLAAGLLAPARGEVRIAGVRLEAPSALIGFVFQAPTLLEWLTARDDVLLPLALHREVTDADRGRARDLLARLGLADLDHRYPSQLSGGQQARVALARAVIDAPAVLLLDEPFAALDALTREELQDDLARLAGETGATVMLVTHDIREAVYLADVITVMGPGRLASRCLTALPRPRPAGLRYEARFNERCRAVRAELDAAT
jgi:NitT/TauT family transport system ATP-binding protein